MPTSTTNPRLAPLGYTGKAGRYDECVDAAGRLRAPWADFFSLLGTHPATALRVANDTAHRAIVEQDVSMNVYRGEQTGTQLWPFDVLPLLIAHEEWQTISRGLSQRARLFDAILRDLYGDQRLLRDGLLPAALVMANPHFLRACAGLGRPDQVMLHTYAVDVARSPDGGWWVLEDRLDAPSGLGYSLQNRLIARQALTDVFRRAPVRRLRQYFDDYRNSVEQRSPNGEDPRVVLLSPGPANETYHEQVYLSRYLGYSLVEGEDLTTRDRQVFLRTVGGLRRVDVVLRRLDSEFIDPLELDAQSLLGVPGLVNSLHAGEVGMSNLPGARALESPALLAFLQPLCRHVLGEDLIMPSAATWWCGQDAPRDYVQRHLEELVIKPVFRTRDAAPTRYGAWMSKAARTALAARIAAEPWAWCGQERVYPSTTPGWHDGALRPMPFITRLYVVRKGDDYTLMPGGLTRGNPQGKDLIVSLQQGSVSKDTWVLHPGPSEPPPLLLSSRPGETLRQPDAMPSRMANNLFWLGRYLERSSQLARKLGKIDALLRDEIALLDPTVPGDVLSALYRAQEAVRPADRPLDEQVRQIQQIAEDPAQPASLAANVSRLVRLLEQLKISLPHEGAPLLRQLRQRRVAADEAACAWLHQQLAALESLTSDAMPRDLGWRFLDLGRWIERGQQLCQLLPALLPADLAAAPTEFRLQSLLHLADSLFTYRSLYHGQIDGAGTLDWLLQSPQNPRGFRFVADKINRQLRHLPTEPAPHAVSALRALAAQLSGDPRLGNPGRLAADPTLTAGLLHDLRAGLIEMNAQLTVIYFSHTAHLSGHADLPHSAPDGLPACRRGQRGVAGAPAAAPPGGGAGMPGFPARDPARPLRSAGTPRLLRQRPALLLDQ